MGAINLSVASVFLCQGTSPGNGPGCVHAVSTGRPMGKHSDCSRANITPRHTTQGGEC